jgi:hypothetical protein
MKYFRVKNDTKIVDMLTQNNLNATEFLDRYNIILK